MKIGVIGGTFDPIHIGHLIMGDYARDYLKLDLVLYIPVGLPSHKEGVTPSEIRMQMVNLAIGDNEYFESSHVDIIRDKETYTIDTIKDLKILYPFDEIYFIIGADSLYMIESWKDFKTLKDMCKFVVLERGYQSEISLDMKLKYFKEVYNLSIIRIKSPIIEISSTEIRDRVKMGLSIRYLVSPKVEDYILREGLYIWKWT